MIKWPVVIFGIILILIVKSFFAFYEFIGLLIVGFIIGYTAKLGILNGAWNAMVTGALGILITAIIFIISAFLGGGMFRLFGGMTGFTVSGGLSLISILDNIIYYTIIMGITGAIGGIIASER